MRVGMAELIILAASTASAGSYLQSHTTVVEGLGSFYPGWAFAARVSAGLGYPPLPHPTYDMRSSTVAYFLGNDTGLNNAAELLAESRFGIVGIGWQIHMRGAGWAQARQGAS